LLRLKSRIELQLKYLNTVRVEVGVNETFEKGERRGSELGGRGRGEKGEEYSSKH